MMVNYFLAFLVLVNVNLKCSEAVCGYESCHQPKEGYVNVHIVSHSHEDVGWLKTVDQYFYGQKQSNSNAGVQYILDSVVDSLQRDEDRRFIYVETAFFWKWWTQQNEKTKGIVKELVENGQLEFDGGGWSMNDEATTNYQSIIDQMTWGLRRLNDTFGTCGRPKIGWQIDPFGHSKEMANILAGLGFDAFIMVRIHYETKAALEKKKEMEFLWRGSDSIGRPSDIFSTVLSRHYDAPDGFCWDGIMCQDDPIITEQESPLYNADEMVTKFFSHVDSLSGFYNTSNVLVTMGHDFTYQAAEVWFNNIDKLISVANAKQVNGSKYNLLYSTPSCYVKAVYDETKGVLNSTRKDDDFFPLATDANSYWTGYYTSRPNLKRFERTSNNVLQVCKQLFTVANISSENEENLNYLREAMGVLQHHDAITGTETQGVALDYARLLQIGVEKCQQLSFLALSDLRSTNTTSIPNLDLTTCPLTNLSQCHLTESIDSFVVTVYNPLSRPVFKFVRLPVVGTSYSVRDPEGNELITDVLPIFDPILSLSGRKSNATYELIFVAEDVPPLGFKSYFVTRQNGNDVLLKTVNPEKVLSSSNRRVGVVIDQETGLVSSIVKDNVSYPVNQNFWYYNGGGGAYNFNPGGDAVLFSDKASTEVLRGALVTEIRQVFVGNIYQTVRLYENEDFVEFDWVIGGPNNNDSLLGTKQIITKFQTNFNSSKTFYTDANGRQTIKRTRSHEDARFNFNEKVASNYRPVTSVISIKDEKSNLEFAVLTDRGQGGASLQDGELELMIYRNKEINGNGVGENLIGTDFAYRGSHFVVVGSTNSSDSKGQSISALKHDIAQRKLLDSLIFLSPAGDTTFEKYKSTYNMQFSSLNRSLPQKVHIVTLEPWKDSGVLLRLEHVFDKNQDPEFSRDVTIDLKPFAPCLNIASLNQLRWHLTTESNCPASELPPTDHAFRQHVKRCLYQLKIWYNSHIQNMPIEDPTLYGWTLEENTWKPNFSSQEPVPDDIKKTLSIRCSDKDCSSNRCTCVLQGLKCCSDCKYANCSNSLTHETPDETSSDCED